MKKNTSSQVKRGRPVHLADAFAARIMARKSGFSDRHCRRLLTTDPSELSAEDWRAVAVLIEHGIESADAAEATLRHAGWLG